VIKNKFWATGCTKRRWGGLVEKPGRKGRSIGFKEKRDGKNWIGNPVRNSSGALNPAGIIIKPNPAAGQRGIISNGVKS